MGTLTENKITRCIKLDRYLVPCYLSLGTWYILLPVWSYLWIVCRSSGWHYSLQLGHLESIKVLGSLRFPNFVLSKALSTFYQLIKYCKFGYLSFLVYGVWESKSNLLVAYSIWWQVIVFRCMSLRFDLQCSFEQSNYVAHSHYDLSWRTTDSWPSIFLP